MYIIVTLLIMAATIALDQITKYLTVANLALGESFDVIPGVLRFTYVQNKGAAFGSFDDSRWVFMIISTVMIAAILIYIYLKKPEDKLLLSSLLLLAGGGIGNMIDRVILGYVIDFIDFCAFPKIWMWVFNIADSCVCIGAGLLTLWLIIDTVRESKAANYAKQKSSAVTKAPKDEAEEEK